MKINEKSLSFFFRITEVVEDHEVAIDYKKRRKLSAVFKNEAELTKAE